jgi:hypothetical protein
MVWLLAISVLGEPISSRRRILRAGGHIQSRAGGRHGRASGLLDTINIARRTCLGMRRCYNISTRRPAALRRRQRLGRHFSPFPRAFAARAVPAGPLSA